MVMEKYDLAGKLREVAAANDWVFIMGTSDYANAANKANEEFEVGQYLLWVDITPGTTRGQGQQVEEISYIGSIALLGKFDEGGTTDSNLDEDIEQKYDRRLLTIVQTLSQTLTDIYCSQNLRSQSENYTYVYNIFDTNFDGVVCQINVIQTDFE